MGLTNHTLSTLLNSSTLCFIFYLVIISTSQVTWLMQGQLDRRLGRRQKTGLAWDGPQAGLGVSCILSHHLSPLRCQFSQQQTKRIIWRLFFKKKTDALIQTKNAHRAPNALHSKESQPGRSQAQKQHVHLITLGDTRSDRK